jgi:lysozyme
MDRKAIAGMVLAASTLVGIAGHEHFVAPAYMPTPNDVPTFGWGTTKGVKMGDTITPDRALKRLEEELDTVYVAGVKRCVKVPLYDYEFGAYISFTYNLGVSAFCNSTMVEKLNKEDYAGACAELSKWNKQKGKVLGGLTKRREEERAICEGRA